MSHPIYVEAYSGYRANERPLRFWLDARSPENELTRACEIDAVEDRWYDPNAEYFKVRTREGKHYILRYDELQEEWTLDRGLDGEDLPATPGSG